MTCRARADRWVEEEVLLREEMRRVIVHLDWKSRAWSDRVEVRLGSCPPDIQHGLDAYARKQANVYRELAVSFAGQWLPYLKGCGLDTKWTAELSWLSPILSCKTALSKRFLAISTDDPEPSPAVDSMAGLEAQGFRACQVSPKTQSDSTGHEWRLEKDFGDEEKDSDEEEEESDEEGYLSDGAVPGDELGFEYDDKYMS